jgi:flagellar basal-body rod modification protein FlgD
MSTTPVTAPTAGTAPTAASQSAAGGAFKADSSTFMTLLVENMKHQDPMQPQDSTAFMQQISQMTMVEQLTALADTSKQAAKDQSTAKTVGLLGRTVTYLDAAGASHSGVVQRVDVSTATPTMTVAGVAGVDPSRVTEVA